MEVQFWERLGLTSEAIERLPWKKVVEYSTYIEILLQKEAMDRAKQKG
jgi:hypothetical protein